MCGNNGPRWKREKVPDHKFDFIDTREFTDNGCGMRSKYMWLYIIVLKDFLVYVLDIFTAITMLTSKQWSNQIFNDCPKTKNCVAVPFDLGRWMFVGCIIFGFLLLAYEAHKSKKIVASRDISYAFTNVMANNYYSLRSYDHFCFFDHIRESSEGRDSIAFFVFFTFKSWKRVLLSDGPRQAINALTLYAVYQSKKNNVGDWYDVTKYFRGNTIIASALTLSTLFTVLIFAGSLLLLILAAVFYIPLLCHIQGNLKEYCCHKVDKRIHEIMTRKKKQRQQRADELSKKEAAGDYSHLKNKKGEIVGKPQPQPTLPVLSVDDDLDDISSMKHRGPPGGYDGGYYSDQKSSIVDYPIMPAYNQPYSPHQAPGYPQYNASVSNVYDDRYDDDTGSQVNLASAAAPIPRDPNYGYITDHYNVYHPDEQEAYGQQVEYPQSTRTPAPAYEPYTHDPYARAQGDPYGNDLYYQQPGYGYGQPQPQHRGGDGSSDGAHGYARAMAM
jgi:hypothetical protein